MQRPTDLVLQWQPSGFTGWGVYGLNLLLHWAGDPDLRPVCSVPFAPARLALDPLRRHRLAPVLAASCVLQEALEPHAGVTAALDVPVLSALDGDFLPLRSAHDVLLTGNPDFAAVFFETGAPDPEAVRRLDRYRLVVCGSTWNRRVLEEHGAGNAVTILQGIDDTLFHPAPAAGLLAGRFAVFSGGKLELRKGQDLTLLAFRAFAARHPEAVLVTAWHSPWPGASGSVAANLDVAPVPLTADGGIDAVGWAAANGIAPERVIDLGPLPNPLLPPVLREMDVAVFPNRCEGGTNLVAMEAMACGVPAVLAAGTGQADLIAPGACLPLTRRRPVPFAAPCDTAGWDESDVEEIVEALETVWRDRAAARALGLRGAGRMAALSWRAQAAELKGVLLGSL